LKNGSPTKKDVPTQNRSKATPITAKPKPNNRVLIKANQQKKEKKGKMMKEENYRLFFFRVVLRLVFFALFLANS